MKIEKKWEIDLGHTLFAAPIVTEKGLILWGEGDSLNFLPLGPEPGKIKRLAHFERRPCFAPMGGDRYLIAQGNGMLVFDAADLSLRPRPMKDFLLGFGFMGVPDRASFVAERKHDGNLSLLCIGKEGNTLWETAMEAGTNWRVCACDEDHIIAWRKLTIALLHKDTGAIVATTTLPAGRRITRMVVCGDRCYVRVNGKIEVLNRKTLALEAPLKVGTELPIKSGNRLYLTARGKLFCLDAQSHDVCFEADCYLDEFPENSAFDSPLIHKDRVFFGSHNMHLWCFDALTGQLLDKYRVGHFINHTPVVDGRYLYVESKDNTLHCFDLDSSAKPPPKKPPTPGRQVKLENEFRLAGYDPDRDMLLLHGQELALMCAEVTSSISLWANSPVLLGDDVYFTVGEMDRCKLMRWTRGGQDAVEVSVTDTRRNPFYQTPRGDWIYLEHFHQDYLGEGRCGWSDVELQTGPRIPEGLIIKRAFQWQGSDRQDLMWEDPKQGNQRLIHLADSECEISMTSLCANGRYLAFCVGGYDLGNDLIVLDLQENRITTRVPLLEFEWDGSGPAWIDEHSLLQVTTSGSYQEFVRVTLDGKVETLHIQKGYVKEAWILTANKTLIFSEQADVLRLIPL